MEVTVDEAQADFPQLLARVEAGRSVVITRDGRIVATLSPAGSVNPRRGGFGSLKGRIRMAEDFDAPLPDDMLKKLYE